MIKVNLLATSPGAAPPRVWLPPEQKSALMGLAMLVVTVLGVGGWWWYLSYSRSSIDRQIVAAEAELVRLREAAKLLEAANARKALLARAAQPFFRRPGGGSRLPIRIAGPRSKPAFRLDVRRAFWFG